jgi:hypothetical protein
VRPDAGGGDGGGGGNARAGEEWMIDSRRSLIAFKGREGGEYYYGTRFPPFSFIWRTKKKEKKPANASDLSRNRQCLHASRQKCQDL